MTDYYYDTKWFWDGNLSAALESIKDEAHYCLLERGTLVKEDDLQEGVMDLITGDVVYMIWSGDPEVDPRERLFEWSLVDPFSGKIAAAAWRG